MEYFFQPFLEEEIVVGQHQKINTRTLPTSPLGCEEGIYSFQLTFIVMCVLFNTQNAIILALFMAIASQENVDAMSHFLEKIVIARDVLRMILQFPVLFENVSVPEGNIT